MTTRKRALQRVPSITDADCERAKKELAKHADGLHDPNNECLYLGSLLGTLAEQHAFVARQLFPEERDIGPRGRWRWGSMSPGCDGLHFMWKAIEGARQTVDNYEVEFVPSFGFAPTASSFKWINHVFGNEGLDVCIFQSFPDGVTPGNMASTGSPQKAVSTGSPQKADCTGSPQNTACAGQSTTGSPQKVLLAPCWTHRGKCPVPDCEFLHVGWKVSASRKQWKAAIVALTTFLDTHPSTCVIVFESADHIEQGDIAVDKMELLDAELGGRDFLPQKFLMSLDRFGVPSDLRHLLAVYIKSSGVVPAINFENRSGDDMMNTLQKLIKLALRKPPSAREILFGFNSHCKSEGWDYVEIALQFMLKQEPARSRDWVQSRQELYTNLGLRWGCIVASEDSVKSPWWQTLSPQQRDSLALYQHLQKSTELMVDLESHPNNPRVCRSFTDGEGCTRCVAPVLNTKSRLWLCDQHRTLIPVEKLLLTGYPANLIPEVLADADQADIDVVAFSMPCLPLQLAIVMSVCAAVSWKCPGEDVAAPSTQGESDEASLFLMTLREAGL